MRKIKYSKVLILGILIYIIFQVVISIISKNVQTLVLENEKIDAKLTTKGLLIREEYVVKAKDDGKVDLLVKEGERVKKSQEIARIYKKNIDSDINKSIEVLSEEIDQLKKGDNNISKDDIKNLNLKIDAISDTIQQELLNGNYNDISENKEILNKLIEEKNKLLKNDIDTKKLETKKEQIEILKNQKEKNIDASYSEISGITSYIFDGNEEKYNYDNLDKIVKKDIENTDNKYSEVNSNTVKKNEPILRIINNYDTYLAICVDKKEKENFEIGNLIKLDTDKQSIDAKVYKMYKDGNNFIIIFKISNQNVAIYDTRVKEFDIIYKRIEGLKIPKTAIETQDNRKYVYVVDEESKNVIFVELKGIEYEDEDFVFVDYYKNDIDGVKSVNLYDKIILKPNIINKNMKIE